jgi:hypothetical protein
MAFDDNESNKSSESSNSGSEDSETFDLRHKGICEKCRTIGVIGTECPMCEDKSCILTEPTENVLSYLKEKEETSTLGLEQLCSLMNINGAGLCGRCLHLGPMGMYCRRCTKEVSTTEKTPRYDSQEEILENHEGICPVCNITGENLMVCQQCMESVFVKLPEHDKAEGSQDNEDKTEDNQVVITMGGGKSRQHGQTTTTQWLLDSGATVHVTSDSDVLLRARKFNEQVRVGNWEDAKAERIGDVEMIVGENDKFLLKDVLHVPGFLKNVVSLMKIVNNGITV